MSLGFVCQLVFTLVLYISCQQLGEYVWFVGCLWALGTKGSGVVCQLVLTLVLYISCQQLGKYVWFIGCLLTKPKSYLVEILSDTNFNFKRSYLGNKKRYRRSAGAKILVFLRALIPSFMKVAWRHSFTLFRPLQVKETTFFGCSRCVPMCLFEQNMPPCRKKKLLVFAYFWHSK